MQSPCPTAPLDATSSGEFCFSWQVWGGSPPTPRCPLHCPFHPARTGLCMP